MFCGQIFNFRVFLCFQELAEHGCVEKLATVLLDIETRMIVLTEVTAALAVMADDGRLSNGFVCFVLFFCLFVCCLFVCLLFYTEFNSFGGQST